MTAKKFLSALGNISENYINEAAAYSCKRKSKAWVKWVAMAACLSLFLTGAIVGTIFRSPATPDAGITSYFVLTAQAANGEMVDLGVTESCFNSGPHGGNIFGVDMPLFHFSLRPSDLKHNEVLYSRFDISVSYNGSLVGDKDEHVMVGYLIPAYGSDEPWSYSISGWFEEPTDIIINITDKQSHEIVETITLNVNYIAHKQGYELQIKNITTEFH